MNKHLHRIIFNAKRGCKMAVAETATAQGKDAGDTSLGKLAATSLITLTLAALPTALVQAQIVADPNAPTNRQPVIITSGNGVPVVNIQTPTAGGVSMNMYNQFNVGTNGAILNNARNNTQTQLGGWIQGNPYLATGSATLIVNQVNSNNPTLLNGYIEVAGQRASVVIANPSGIQVNGAGFINAQSAVLTTGIPNFNGNVITGYTVNQGTVSVGGTGLDLSTTDYSSILARAVEVNAGIWAKQLTVVAGANQIDASVANGGNVATGSNVNTIAGTGPAPTFAIDVSSLGGMYAGKILLIGTEAGLGVNLKGTVMGVNTSLLAGPGQVHISSNGWLSNSGTIQSTTNTTLVAAGNTNNSGNVYAAQNLNLSSGGNVTNSGLLAANGNVAIAATGANSHITNTNTSVLAAGLNANGSLQTLGIAGDLTLTATQGVNVHGQAIASNNLSATGATVSLANSSVFAVNVNATASAGELNATGASIQATNSITLTTPTTLTTSNASVSSPNVNIAANDWVNRGGQVVHTSSNAWGVNLVGNLDNTGGVIQTTNAQMMNLTAANIDNTRGQIAQTYNVSGQVGSLSVNTANGNLTNTNGTIYTTGDLGVQSGQLTNTNGTVLAQRHAVLNTTGIASNGGLIQTAGNLSINTNGGALVNTNTASAGLIAGGKLDIQAGAIDSSNGRIATTANQTTTITATSLNSTNGLIVGETLTISTGTGVVNNTNGTVYARADLNVQSGQLTNTNGTIATASNANLNTTGISSDGGLIQTGGNLSLNTNGGAFDNSNTASTGVVAGGVLTIQAGAINNSQGRIANTGNQTTNITAISLNSDAGLIVGHAVNLNTGTGTVSNNNGTIYARADLTLQSGQLSNNNGTIATAANANLNTAGINSDGGLIQTGANLTINTNSGDLVNTNTASAGIVSGGALSVQTNALNNSNGRIANTGTQDTSITATSLNNTNGLVVTQNLGLALGGNALNNTNGTIYSRADLTVQSGQLTNTNGTLASAGQTVLNTTGISSDGGLIQTGGNLSINTNGGVFTNTNTLSAGVVSAGALTIQAGVIDSGNGRIANTGNQTTTITAISLNSTNGLIVGEALNINTGTGNVININGTVYARANLTVQSGQLTNTNGTIAAAIDATLNTTGISSDGGLIQTGGNLTINTNVGNLVNTNTASAGIVSGGILSIQTNSLNNTLGRIANTGTQNTTLSTTSIDNTGGLVLGQNLTLTNSGAVNNTNGTVYVRGDLTVQSQNFTNTQGVIAAANHAALNTTGLDNTQGLVQTGGNLTIQTNAGNLVNTNSASAGIVSGGALTIQTQALDNNLGRIANTGAQNTTLTVASLDNSNGLLVTQNLSLTSSGAVNNTNATLYARGDLALSSTQLTNTNGTLAALGNATLTTTGLSGDNGLIQTGGDLTLTTQGGAFNQTNAQLYAQNATLSTGAFTANNSTLIARSNLDVSATTLTASNNSTLAAANTAALTTTSALSNDHSLIQGGNTLAINTTGAALTNANTQFTNSTLGLVSGAAMTVKAGAMDNSGGRVASSSGNSVINVSSLTNTGGLIAAQNMTLSSGAIDNTNATLYAQNLNLSATQITNTNGTLYGNNITAAAVQLSNANGTVFATNDANLSITNTNNNFGVVQTGANLSLAGATLTNTNGSVAASGNAVLNVGNLNNDAGLIQTVGNLQVNTSGGTFSNRNTDVMRVGNVSIGVISSGNLSINSDTVDNTRGRIVAASNTSALNLVATTLTNTNGSIASLNDATLQAASLNNVNGSLYAANNLSTTVTGALTNTNGTLFANNYQNITAGSLTGDGTVWSNGSLNVQLGSSYTHGLNATLAARLDATLNVSGDITNYGKLQAGGNLNLVSTNLDNTATGEIAASNTSIVTANTFTNRGLVDGFNTYIKAGNINNIGTGRIYGTYIALQANNLLNDAETVNGVTTAATIAARYRLDIGANSITNTNNALIYSDGNIFIGGALDANRTATGMAGTLINNGSTIEAANALVVNASSIQNLNRNFAYTLNTVAGTATTSEFVSSAGTFNSNTTWNTGRGYLVSGGQGGGLRYYYEGQVVVGSDENGAIMGTGNAGFAGSGNTKGFVLNPNSVYNTQAYKDIYLSSATYYSTAGVAAPANNAVWATMGVTQPTSAAPAGARPALVCNAWGPADENGAPCIGNTPASIAAQNNWDTAAAPYLQLQNSVNSLRTAIESQSVSYDGWREYTTNTQTIAVTSSNAGKMLSGGYMGLNAGTELVNNMSQIVAGGTLAISGAAVDNRQLTVTANSTRNGTAYTWRQYDHGCGSLKGCDYNYQAYGGSAYSLVIPQTLTLGTSQSVGSASIATLKSNAVIAAKANVSAVAVGALNLVASNLTKNETLGQKAFNVSAIDKTTANLSVANTNATNITSSASATNVSVSATATAVNGTTAVGNATATTTTTNTTYVNYAANRTAVGAPTYYVKNVGTTVSNSSLFRPATSSTATYLIETDPKFANYRIWLGSDYMLSALSLDPQTTQKRLGDGFYEQRLICEQVATLTGNRFLDGYSDEEQQFKDLMDNAIALNKTYGKAWNLRPGIALSDEQMAQLTSDIVWLVEREVTLPDGSKQKALVPQLYTKLRSGDLNESGALLGGANVVMNLTGDLNNAGTIAGRNIVSLTANNLNNLNSIAGNVVSLNAKNDINVIGGTVQASSALFANAGRNINVASTATSGVNDQQTTTTVGGGSGMFKTIGEPQTITSGNKFSYQGIDRVAGLYVGSSNGTLAISAGGNVNLTAANIINSGANSSTSIQANGSINLATIRQGSTNSVIIEAGKQFLNDAQTSEVGTSIIGGNNVTLSAANINMRAANIQAGVAENATSGALALIAKNNINITAGEATQSYGFANKAKIGGGGLFGSDGETVTIVTNNNTFAQGSNLGGSTVTVQAGSFSGNGTQSVAGAALGNVNVVGSNILSTNGTNILSTGNVNITNAVNTFNSTFYQQTTESGFLSGGGGIGFTYGDRTQRQTNNQSGTTAAASTIGSTNGSINVQAGGNVLITGSNLVTGTLNSTSKKLEGSGDINIAGANVTINEARETKTGQSTTFFEQTALTVAVNIPGMAQLQGAASTAQAAGKTSNSRVAALGMATAGYQAYQGAQALGGAASGASGSGGAKPSVSISATMGTTTSSSSTNTTANSAAGSGIQAAGNVNIQATAGNLTIQGSDVSANNNVSLSATQDVNLLAAANTQSQTSTSKSSSTSVGVAASLGSGGMAIGVTGSVSGSRGNADGQDLTYTNTQVNAGNTLTIRSGGNTNLIGAVASGNTTNVIVGGNLVIQSLQDKSTYDSKDTSFGVSATVGMGASASVSLGKTTVNSNFQSVNQTSGIQAGAGGFNVQVGGNTTLIGGQITSNQSAIDQGLNTFSTNGTLTTSDIKNSSQFDAKSMSITVGTSGGGAGFGSASGSQSGTTVSAISAGNITVGGVRTNTSSNGNSLNTGTVTGQNNAGNIQNTFNATAVKEDVAAQVAITRAFTQNAAKLVGDIGADKTKPIDDANTYKDLKSREGSLNEDERKALNKMESDGYNLNTANAALADPKNQEDYSNWKEGGPYRVLAHTLVGGLAGGVGGALGAGTSQALVPIIGEEVAKLDIPQGLKSVIIQVAGTAIGMATGGTAGGATAQSATANNYLNHEDLSRKLALQKQKQSACGADSSSEACAKATSDLDKIISLDEGRDKMLRESCTGPSANEAQCNAYKAEALAAANSIDPTKFRGADYTAAMDEKLQTVRLVTNTPSAVDQVTKTKINETLGKAIEAGAMLYPMLRPLAGALKLGESEGTIAAGSDAANAYNNILRKALEEAQPTTGGSSPQQLMATLPDGTRVLFRKDFGDQAHPVGGPYQGQGRLDHYNIEVQVPKPNGGAKIVENVHIVPDGKGGFTWWGKDGVVKP